jgi:hypothetical protein
MFDYITFYIITVVVCSHFIADFVFQSDKMATRKAECGNALFDHCITYAAVTWLLWMVFIFGVINDVTISVIGLFAYLLLTHLFVDSITSKITKYYYTRNRHVFFVIIGFDQVIHYITLFLYIFIHFS